MNRDGVKPKSQAVSSQQRNDHRTPGPGHYDPNLKEGFAGMRECMKQAKQLEKYGLHKFGI